VTIDGNEFTRRHPASPQRYPEQFLFGQHPDTARKRKNRQGNIVEAAVIRHDNIAFTRFDANVEGVENRLFDARRVHQAIRPPRQKPVSVFSWIPALDARPVQDDDSNSQRHIQTDDHDQDFADERGLHNIPTPLLILKHFHRSLGILRYDRL